MFWTSVIKAKIDFCDKSCCHDGNNVHTVYLDNGKITKMEQVFIFDIFLNDQHIIDFQSEYLLHLKSIY